MVRHNHVSEEQEPSRCASFIESFAGNNLKCVGLEDRQAVFGNDSNVKSLGVSRDSEFASHRFGAEPRMTLKEAFFGRALPFRTSGGKAA